MLVTTCRRSRPDVQHTDCVLPNISKLLPLSDEVRRVCPYAAWAEHTVCNCKLLFPSLDQEQALQSTSEYLHCCAVHSTTVSMGPFLNDVTFCKERLETDGSLELTW